MNYMHRPGGTLINITELFVIILDGTLVNSSELLVIIYSVLTI